MGAAIHRGRQQLFHSIAAASRRDDRGASPFSGGDEHGSQCLPQCGSARCWRADLFRVYSSRKGGGHASRLIIRYLGRAVTFLMLALAAQDACSAAPAQQRAHGPSPGYRLLAV